MNRNVLNRRNPLARALRSEWWAAPAAFLVTLLALPVNAGIVIPDEPLTTGNRVAPNILFIMDDSGSMARDYMPEDPANTTAPDVSDLAYTRNTLSYDPSQIYQAWMGADGNRVTGGTGYTSVYSDDSLRSGSTNLSNSVQTFYVPKDTTNTTAAYLGNGENYYRYQILTDGKVVKSEYLTYTAANSPSITESGTLGNSGTGTINGVRPTSGSWTFNVPTNAYDLVISSSGGTCSPSNSRCADLYARRNNNPSTSNYDERGIANGNAETISVSNPTAGTWYVRLYNGTNYTGSVTASYSYKVVDGSLGCATTRSGKDWRGCVEETPTGRTADAEKANYAVWYSYHRTRMKVAKAGASEAFRGMGNKVRVGYWDIHDRTGSTGTFNIPVTKGDGRFVNDTTVTPNVTNRTDWYNYLFNQTTTGSTPLRSALKNAGEYFSSTGPSGPYGPEPTASQYSCRQNFTILTTDGYWNTGDESGGFTSSWGLGTIGDEDSTNGATITGPKSASYQYLASAPYNDGSALAGHTLTLADIAMFYWKKDLRTLTNNVPSTDANPAFWQHMVTFGISIGLTGASGYTSVGAIPSNYSSWPNPQANVTGVNDIDPRIDDLLHAAVNGRGTFVAATNPTAFAAGLRNALAVIAQRTASYSNVATNSTSLNTGAQVFSASYTSGLWTGSVTARAVTRSGVSNTLTWTGSIPAFATRNIKVFTSNGSTGAAFPTATQAAALVRTGGPVDYPVTATENANYIKGDPSKEERNGGLLRNRIPTVLGDIVGSSPAYVKDTGTLYVGANDGMLHAFDAANGQELFAYVPNIINFNNLAMLSRGDYDHKFFVDGPVVVTNRALTPNKNVLVGALGKGGKGLYSLDVSTPASFGAGSFKWERAETAGNNMGLVQGAPLLAAVRNGSPTNAVVLGNGVNSTNDRAVLIVLDLETGAVIREIDTGAGSTAAPNGLSAPTGVYAADGKTLLYAYAGDLLGNVWKFNLTSTSPAAWTATKIFNATKGSVAQPITSALTVATDPVTRKRWVFFGTGRFMTTGDADDKTASAQSMYGFMDEGQTSAYGRGNLTQRGITVAGDVRSFDAKAPLAATSKGWYVDLPGAGERIVQDAQIASTFLITASMIPEGDACEASGTGYINAIDAFTGTSGGASFFDLDGDGNTDDAGAGGSPVGSVNLGVGMPTRPILLPGQIVVGGTGDGTAAGLGGSDSGGMEWGRVSWREIRED
ncbi:MAG: pilus assembly protein [Lysobacteraceae bacterium]|nr:MAG: pilus assembly protein [Xanthomonadaceae bacterium]